MNNKLHGTRFPHLSQAIRSSSSPKRKAGDIAAVFHDAGLLGCLGFFFQHMILVMAHYHITFIPVIGNRT